ncbi:MAG TPA: hypothetical protein VJ751_03340 [Pyrinomonadaceae bacterium]|jgi:hypothetical protein|nr:hypothetical protein [Pyrinomonadaceae bacterium]
MKHSLKDPIHNPFHNRFHVPVHSRLDEMQAYTQVVWLKDPAPLNSETENDQNTRPRLRAVAGAFALVLLVAFSAVFLSSFLN